MTADQRRQRAMDAVAAMPYAHPAQSEAILQMRADAVEIARLRDQLPRARAPVTQLRIPKKDDPFFVANAGRMFMLLTGVEHHPPGCPLDEALRLEIQKLYAEAYEDGIDTIGVAEGGLEE